MLSLFIVAGLLGALMATRWKVSVLLPSIAILALAGPMLGRASRLRVPLWALSLPPSACRSGTEPARSSSRSHPMSMPGTNQNAHPPKLPILIAKFNEASPRRASGTPHLRLLAAARRADQRPWIIRILEGRHEIASLQFVVREARFANEQVAPLGRPAIKLQQALRLRPKRIIARARGDEDIEAIRRFVVAKPRRLQRGGSDPSRFVAIVRQREPSFVFRRKPEKIVEHNQPDLTFGQWFGRPTRFASSTYGR